MTATTLPEPAARCRAGAAGRRRSSPASSASRSGRRGAHWVTILGVLVSFIGSAMVLDDVVIDGARFNATIYEWMVIGGLKMEVGFLIDGLTAMMMCVVTFVSLMVHIYTIGYMGRRLGYQRFFSYISPVHLLDADARDEQQLPAAVLRLGGRGPGVVPADFGCKQGSPPEIEILLMCNNLDTKIDSLIRDNVISE